MATIKDVEEIVAGLDVKVKIVHDSNATASVNSNGEITLGLDFLTRISATELKFTIMHEYGHLQLDHFHRIKEGEQQLTLEYEADKYATQQLISQNTEVCGKIKQIEDLRPSWDTTHPSKTSLRGLSCGSDDVFIDNSNQS